jgi:hypothetical protein
MGLRCSGPQLRATGTSAGATRLVRESFGWRAAHGADTDRRVRTLTARPPSGIVHRLCKQTQNKRFCHALVRKKRALVKRCGPVLRQRMQVQSAVQSIELMPGIPRKAREKSGQKLA